MEQEFEDLDTAGVLAGIGRLRALQAEVERDRFLLVAHFADLHNADGLLGDPDGWLPGHETGIRLGGADTPKVRDLAIGELAAELGRSTYSTRRLIGDVLELRHRLPRMWQLVLDCVTEGWLARKVAQATRDLTREQALFVDAEVAGYADGRLPAGRFLDLLAGKVVAADPEAAAERERRAATERFAKVGRSNDHGQKTLYVKASAAEIIRINATIDHLATGLTLTGHPGTLDERRALAVLILANPVAALTLLQRIATRHAHDRQGSEQGWPGEAAGEHAADQRLPEDPEDGGADPQDPDGQPVEERPAWGAVFAPLRPGQVPACTCRGGDHTWDPATLRDLLPTVTLYLHLNPAGHEVVRWEGEGPVSTSYLRDVLGPRARFVVKPVIDLAHQAPVDGYETPDRLREAVHLRTPADTFPYGTCTSRTMDADHTIPYHPGGDPPGQTRTGNLGFLTRHHHRIKTHTGWQVRQPFEGIFVWQAPHGALYLVDHTGTRQIRSTQVA